MCSASAEMMTKSLANCSLIWISVPVEQANCGHDHTIQTITALSRGLLYEGRLHRMQMLGRAKTFERRYAPRTDCA
jgi:hypothetical protein